MSKDSNEKPLQFKEKFGLDVGMKNMTSCVIMKEGKR